ncbi:hypothetical protein BFDFBN_BFDFBN_05950, partial [Dysosmobacter welbionis]
RRCRRRSPPAGCGAGYWWPCPPRCRWSRSPADWETGRAGHGAPCGSRRSWGPSPQCPFQYPAASRRRAGTSGPPCTGR